MNCANEFDNKQKKPSKNNTNLDIRNYFKQTPSQLTINKRIMKVIEPYINEINEENYTLRKRKIVNYKKKFEPSDDEADSLNENEHDEEKEDKSSTPFGSQEASELSDVDSNKKRRYKKKKESKKKRRVEDKSSSDSFSLDEDGNEFEQDYIELRSGKGFNKLLIEAANTITEAEQEIKRLEKEFYTRENMINESKSNYPEHCIPICADIREFKFKALAEKQKEITGQLFDVIMMDPPWQLSSSQPTRGVAIAYDTLNDNIITDIPVQKLQTDGFIFIWTINAKFKVTLDLIKQWGYE